MKKYTHPKVIDTLIQMKNGAIFYKRWNFFKGILALETDSETHFLWKNQNIGLNKKTKKIQNANLQSIK